MVQEHGEFKPSLIGAAINRILDPGTPPVEMLAQYIRASVSYANILEGRITDPEKIQKTIENYNLWYSRLSNWRIHRND